MASGINGTFNINETFFTLILSETGCDSVRLVLAVLRFGIQFASAVSMSMKHHSYSAVFSISATQIDAIHCLTSGASMGELNMTSLCSLNLLRSFQSISVIAYFHAKLKMDKSG